MRSNLYCLHHVESAKQLNIPTILLFPVPPSTKNIFITFVLVSICQVTEDQVLDMLERILVNNNSTMVTKEYCLMAIMKLSTRFTQTTLRIRKLINIHGTSTNTELQQRSVEFTALFSKHDTMRYVIMKQFLLNIQELNYFESYDKVTCRLMGFMNT